MSPGGGGGGGGGHGGKEVLGETRKASGIFTDALVEDKTPRREGPRIVKAETRSLRSRKRITKMLPVGKLNPSLHLVR